MKRTQGITLLELTIALGVMLIALGVVMVSAGGRPDERRALENATTQLRADMRYAQQLAIMEGRRIGVHFEPAHNRYHIMSLLPLTIYRTVYFTDGVELRSVNYPNNRIMYLPRGTAIPGRIVLYSGRYRREITTTLSGGQVRIHEIHTHGRNSNGTE